MCVCVRGGVEGVLVRQLASLHLHFCSTSPLHLARHSASFQIALAVPRLPLGPKRTNSEKIRNTNPVIITANPLSTPPPLQVLELSMGASKAEIKQAYRRLALLWHPDKHPGDPEGASVKFQEIQRAYDALMSTDEEEKIEQLPGAVP